MGFVSELGRQVRELYECAGGESGLVYFPGMQVTPDPAKLLRVDLPPGAVKFRSTAAPFQVEGYGKWMPITVADIERFHQPVDPTPLVRLVGPCVSGCYYTATARTDYNRVVAVICRAFLKTPLCDPQIWQFTKGFLHLLLPLWLSPPAEMDRLLWLASMPAERRGPLLEAMELYDRVGWQEVFALFHAFIKHELLPLYQKMHSCIVPLVHQIPRLIQAPHDVCHVIASPKIKPYLNWLKEQWHVEHFLFYGSTTPEKLHRWLARATRGPKLVFWSDYSMFDASQVGPHWDFVESVLYGQYKHDQDFQKVLSVLRKPTGTVGRNLKYTGRQCMTSGRPDTALVNALLNGLAMTLSVTSAWYGVPLLALTASHLHRIACELQLSVCGDDALGFLPPVGQDRARHFAEACKKNIASFGFTAKFFFSDRFEDAVYLGHRPYLVAGEWYWGKTLGRCLPKLGFQASLKGDPAAFFMGICKMHQTCSRHVPVLIDVVDRWVACRPGAKVTEYKLDLENKPWEAMSKGPGHYDDSTLEALARAYTVDSRPCRADLALDSVKVDVADFKALIAYVQERVTGLPCVLDHWLLTHMVMVDEQ